MNRYLFMLNIFFVVSVLLTTTTIKANQQAHVFSLHDYLQTNKDKPINFLRSTYYPTPALRKKLLEQYHDLNDTHLIFTTLCAKKINPQAHSDKTPQNLNSLLDNKTGFEYIQHQQLVPLLTSKIGAWLLKQYDFMLTSDNNEPAEITIEGMLHNLQLRSKRGDTIANIVLTQLKKPYLLGSSAETEISIIKKVVAFLRKPLKESKDEDSIIEQISDSLNESDENAAVFNQEKNSRLLNIIESKHIYKKNYLFTECDAISDSTAENLNSGYFIIRGDEEANNMLEACYTPEVIYSDSNIPSATSFGSLIDYCTGINAHSSENFSGFFALLSFISLFHSAMPAPLFKDTTSVKNTADKQPLKLSDCINSCGNRDETITSSGNSTVTRLPSIAGENDVIFVYNTSITAETNILYPQIYEFVAADAPENHNRFILDDFNGTFTTKIHPDNTEITRNDKYGYHFPYAGQYRQPEVFVSNSIIQIVAEDGSIRLTDPTDNSENRMITEGQGRLEIMHDGRWKAVPKRFVTQEALNTACQIQGYKESHSLGRLQAEEDRSGATWQKLDEQTLFLLSDGNCSEAENLQLCQGANLNKSAPFDVFVECVQDDNILLYDTLWTNKESLLRGDQPSKNKCDLFHPKKKIHGRKLSFCSDMAAKDYDKIAHVLCRNKGYSEEKGQFKQGDIEINPNVYCPEELRCTGREKTLHDCKGASSNSVRIRNPNEHKATLECVKKECPECVIERCQNGQMQLVPRINGSQEDITIKGVGVVQYCTDQQFIPLFLPDNNFTTKNNLAEKLCKEMGFLGRVIGVYLLNSTEYDKGHGWLELEENLYSCMKNKQTVQEIIQNCSTKREPDHPLNSSSSMMIHCDTNTSSIPPKLCKKSSLLPEAVLFSGDFTGWDPQCEPTECIAKTVDVDGIKGHPKLLHGCKKDQLLYSTNKEDWRKLNEIYCSHHKECPSRCLLPNIQDHTKIPLDFDDSLRIFRQHYPYNPEAGSKGLIITTNMSSCFGPHLFSAANETIAVNALPVFVEKMHNNVVSLYYSDSEKTGQLVWFPLASEEQLDNEYHAQTLPGKPLAFTKDKVFVYNNDENIIDQYALSTNSDTANNTTTFTVQESIKDLSYDLDNSENITVDHIIAELEQGKHIFVILNFDQNKDADSDQINLMNINLPSFKNHELQGKNISINTTELEHYMLFIKNNSKLLLEECNKKQLINSMYKAIAEHQNIFIKYFCDCKVNSSKVDSSKVPMHKAAIIAVSAFLSMMTIVVAGGGVYYFYKKHNPSHTAKNITSRDEEVPSDSNEDVPDDLSEQEIKSFLADPCDSYATGKNINFETDESIEMEPLKTTIVD